MVTTRTYQRSSLNLVRFETLGMALRIRLTGMIGIKKDSFLTVIDQDDEDTFVNVVINIQEGFVIIYSLFGLGLHITVHWKKTRNQSRPSSPTSPRSHAGQRSHSQPNRTPMVRQTEKS